MTGGIWGIGRRLAIAVMVSALLFPLYWVAVASFTPESQLFGQVDLVPTRLVFDHYRAVFSERSPSVV